ncbi:MAG: DUF4830 domain-containing protein [Acutalibacteraceae bacterium]|jgi:hypothetical protein
MFVVSLKMSRRQILTLIFCVAVLAALILAAVRPSAKATAAVPGGSEQKRVAFLRSLGYTVTPPHTAVREVRIPEDLDDAALSYNDLQQTAGMDLTPYRGKRLKCWTYPVENDPSGQPAEAHLYEYRDTIVAGDVAALEEGGFMRALTAVG